MLRDAVGLPLFQSTLPGWGATAAAAAEVAQWALFQSTLPGWGATRRHPRRFGQTPDFNPRSPDGERLSDHGGPDGRPISIHAPRMGSDFAAVPDERDPTISIHAPRMGSDRENGHLRPRYGQNHPFSTLIVSQIVVDVLGTVRKSQKTPAH